jgi:hypothetical protein
MSYWIVYVKPYTSKSGKQWNIGDVREMQYKERDSSFDDIVKRFETREEAVDYSVSLVCKGTMKKSDNFEVVEQGTAYNLAKYRVIDGEGIKTVIECDIMDKPNQDHYMDEIFQKITFVRGDKSDNGIVIPRVDGITHEQLLGMMITDLEYKNKLVPSEYCEVAIMNLKCALKQLEFRQQDRELRNVVGTYNK